MKFSVYIPYVVYFYIAILLLIASNDVMQNMGYSPVVLTYFIEICKKKYGKMPKILYILIPTKDEIYSNNLFEIWPLNFHEQWI